MGVQIGLGAINSMEKINEQRCLFILMNGISDQYRIRLMEVM